MHLRLLLQELGLEQNGPTTIYEDFNAAIALAHAKEQSKWAKHYQIKVHFLSDQYKRGTFAYEKVDTKMTTFADIVVGWESGRLLPNDNDSARHWADTADYLASALLKKEALDGWECWMFRWTATDLKEKNRNRKEKKQKPHEDRHGAARRMRHIMVCLSQRHRAS